MYMNYCKRVITCTTTIDQKNRVRVQHGHNHHAPPFRFTS